MLQMEYERIEEMVLKRIFKSISLIYTINRAFSPSSSNTMKRKFTETPFQNFLVKRHAQKVTLIKSFYSDIRL